ncbi:hypothetical protein [Teredinibacter turnerae]|uniref:hypothetical protein n=1 Tax=Teredinibacter turnerae TaxID=2426 RepID=UPI000685634D|nr:hypothetical protein [Teredinibacter turnerae]
MTITAITILVILLVGWTAYTGDLPKKYRMRKCTGKHWKEKFPDASKDEIRKFLRIFTDAFAFSEKNKLKFEPEDRILDIYKALYPREWMADALEVETLAENIEAEYGLKFEGLWSEDLTLGALFTAAKNA